jgi:hypothetical protein
VKRPARARWLLAAAIGVAASPVPAETYRNAGPAFEIDYPHGWKILPGEGGLATRAVGPGGSMKVSVTAARRPDFDAGDFTGSELEQISDGLVAATANSGSSGSSNAVAPSSAASRPPSSPTAPW